MQRKIIKAKLFPDTKFMEIEFIEIIPSDNPEIPDINNEIKALYRHEAHPDLVMCYGSLVKHLARLCELVDPVDFLKDIDLPIYNSLTVTKICIGGQNEYEGVVVVGQKKLMTGKVLNLVAPFTAFDSEVSDYSYCTELWDFVEKCIEEINQYIEGKRAPQKQLNLFVAEGSPITADDAADGVRKIRKEFHDNLQKIADKHDATVSVMGPGDTEAVVIAKPHKR